MRRYFFLNQCNRSIYIVESGVKHKKNQINQIKS